MKKFVIGALAMLMAASCGKSYDLLGMPGDLFDYAPYVDATFLPLGWDLERGAYIGTMKGAEMEVILDAKDRVLSFIGTRDGVVYCRGDFSYTGGVRTGTIGFGYGLPDPHKDGLWKVTTFHADGTVTGVGTWKERGVEILSVYGSDGFEAFQIARLKELTDRVTVQAPDAIRQTRFTFMPAKELDSYEVEVLNDKGVWDSFLLISDLVPMEFQATAPPEGGIFRFKDVEVKNWTEIPFGPISENSVTINEGN